ncbi:ADP,ATP carrier protein isoform X2 [Lingula anatina]|uniref:ADP/ATP translocase n=1 Tax=Lingula anatina TaxID=7574 RepID=A0A1S3JN10_LINAN|nr:ADP,ATP carrier protein isoform X1 [Lingula anatina]XP_013411541.1 ADP,ATP carrier protein isoform X2 [Lingula anatina]|eukprot:XP_013411540.1 ADP,ATP carrier protein isoform X1 [Lingula anatina]
MAGKQKLGFAENFALGGLAAVISKTVAAPLERVKLLLQNQDEMIKAGRLDKPYNGMIDCTKQIYYNEGVIPFWRGNVANCIRYFPTQALNFAFKDKIHLLFKDSPTDTYAWKFTKNIFSGGVAGGMSLCVVYSLDYARTRLANDAVKEGSERQYKNLRDVYKQTLKTDGIRGLYRGFGVSVVGIMVYRGFYFGLYDSFKPILLSPDAGFLLRFGVAYCVTIAATMLSYPFDTIRRRMMMKSGEAVKYKSSFDAARQIIKHEGIQSFFKGNLANILRGVACAGVLAGYDMFEKWWIAYRFGDMAS